MNREADAGLRGVRQDLGGATLTHLDLVYFRWGDLHLAVQANQVQGLASAAGLDVPTIGDVLGLPAADGRPAAGPRRLLRLAWAAGVLDLCVQEPVVQVRLPPAAIHPLPLMLAARLRLSGIRALGERPDLGDRPLIMILDARDLQVVDRCTALTGLNQLPGRSAALVYTAPGAVNG